MKIPAHLLSPMPSNSKTAQTAQTASVQSVSDFLNKEPDTSRDFFSALKSLQNLAKPQKENSQQPNLGRNAAPVRPHTVATKVAELKIAEPKIEKSARGAADGEATEVATAPGEGQSHEIEVRRPEVKVTVTESGQSIGSNQRDVEIAVKQSATEQLPVELDAANPKAEKADLPSVSATNNGDTKSAVEFVPGAAKASDQPTSQAPVVRPIEHRPVEPGPAVIKTTDGAEAAVANPQPQRLVTSSDENAKRHEASRPLVDRPLKSEAILRDQASPKQVVDVADKAEIRMETQLPKNRIPAEAPTEPKPMLENVPQAQLKSASDTQPNPANQASVANLASTANSTKTANVSNMVNAPFVQQLPPVPAKDISAQVTRHLNSELLNMELRTQVVSDRATTGAINSSTLTLQLQPIGLGRVQAEIRREGELVRIKLTVEAKGTFEIMKNDIDVLKAAMRALGTAEGDVTLTQGNINRLPNEGATNGQGLFSNERNNQSELQWRQNQDPRGHSNEQSSGEETTSMAGISDPTLQITGNAVTI